ncbi:membrane protein [Mycobacterium parmense]|uniref:Membrane protein n=1 Tax=Mycobacterium parmense TaxID=185642 RepID=A0A7I7YYJ2_9MYCO|nr:membrane protein [Mycobacterium parmense]
MSAPPPGYPIGPPPAYGPPPASGPSPSLGPPPGYYGPPPAYGPPPGYYGPPPAYGPTPGYYGPPQPFTAALRPGIIPLRPLTLSEIFNGAVGYIRTNPQATLGLTAMVVIVMQIVSLVAALGPLAAYRGAITDTPDQLSSGFIGAWLGSSAAGLLITWLGGMLLSGMLTVIVGRAVFGATITIGETWAKIRGRLLPLLALALLEAVVLAALLGLVAVAVALLAAIGNAAVAVVAGLPLALLLIAGLVYLYTGVLFAPVLIVLERLPVMDAIARSFALIRNGFWRVLGIRALTFLVTTVVASAIAAPFTIASQLALGAAMSSGSFAILLLGNVVASLGSAIGQIVTAPFNAGVIVLLYTDRRMRAEAFDLVLQTGAARGPYAVASTDNLWLTRPA